jgi:Acyl-CoA dehydrogenases
MVSVAQLKDVPAQPSLRPDIAELRSRVAQIAPQIKARAHTTEKAGRVPEENITALRNIGYFEIVKPAMFGGYEHDFDVLVELNIELAKSCASTAWVGGLLAAHQWLIAGFPESRAARRLGRQSRCGGLRLLRAGRQGDRGRRRLSPDRTLVVRQRLRQRAMVVVRGAAAVEDRERPVCAGLPAGPASDYVIDDTWNVVGLSGTGSKTLVLNDVFVPRTACCRSPTPHPEDAGRRALCRQPHLLDPDAVEHPLLPGIGCGRRRAGALEDYLAVTSRRITRGAVAGHNNRMADFPTIQLRVAEASASVDAARDVLLRDLRDRAATIRGGPVSIEDRIVSRRGQAFSVALAIRATEALNASTGGLGLDLSNPVQRPGATPMPSAATSA